MTKGLAARVGLTLILNPNTENEDGHRRGQRVDNHLPPEVGIMAMAIIALKMVYGSDFGGEVYVSTFFFRSSFFSTLPYAFPTCSCAVPVPGHVFLTDVPFSFQTGFLIAFMF